MSNTRVSVKGGRNSEYFADYELSTSMSAPEIAARNAERRAALASQYNADKVATPQTVTLKELDPLHKLIIAMYITGNFAMTRIAKELSLSYNFVYRTMQDPLVQEVVNEWKAALELDLEALYPLAIDAVRQGLMSGDKDLRLKAVDRFEKLYAGARPKAPEQENGAITIVNNGRIKFITELREKAKQNNLIDANFTEVKGEEEG